MNSKKTGRISNAELKTFSDSLQSFVKKIVSNLGFQLLDLSFVNENNTNYLRVTVKHPVHRISINDCELISKEIEKELDKKNSIPFSYLLEVQSSGISNSGKTEHEFILEKIGLTIKA